MAASVPIGTIAFVMAFVSIPWRFPYQDSTATQKRGKVTLGRVDIPGTVLLILATLGMTAGFEEAGSKFPWKSAYVISMITISGILWIVLVSWERYVTSSNKIREPVLPWRFFVNRQMLGLLL